MKDILAPLHWTLRVRDSRIDIRKTGGEIHATIIPDERPAFVFHVDIIDVWAIDGVSRLTTLLIFITRNTHKCDQEILATTAYWVHRAAWEVAPPRPLWQRILQRVKLFVCQKNTNTVY